MNYLQIDKASISNGPGVRVVLWVAGCSMHCKGCQNPESWDFYSGKLFDKAAKQELFETLDKPYIKGITFSGGHPLEPENRLEVLKLIKEIKTKFSNKDIWLYTGYTLEDILSKYTNQRLYELFSGINDFNDEDWRNCLKYLAYIDVIVDGPYIEEQRDITLAFRGSKNQRIIDVKETLKQSKIVTIQN